jgi:hypothetical protein
MVRSKVKMAMRAATHLQPPVSPRKPPTWWGISTIGIGDDLCEFQMGLSRGECAKWGKSEDRQEERESSLYRRRRDLGVNGKENKYTFTQTH